MLVQVRVSLSPQFPVLAFVSSVNETKNYIALQCFSFSKDFSRPMFF